MNDDGTRWVLCGCDTKRLVPIHPDFNQVPLQGTPPGRGLWLARVEVDPEYPWVITSAPLELREHPTNKTDNPGWPDWVKA